jgi:hypothetical protein
MPTEIEFDFIKSNLFRVIRSDGIIGGLTPVGAIMIGMYSERQPFPTKMVHTVEAGRLGPEQMDKREARKAIVREIEVAAIMDIAQAIVLRKWLDEKIEQYQQLIGPLPTIPVSAKVNIGSIKGNGKEGKR